ncbi:MAG: 1-acyl-sn-glycerol-3-phosphate acyltransferase [Parcubacteria group bacterium]|nr:1-acyl-sn-glycerol-3-phosphate acyltransferase [Parcubacteria group bacterium]
MKWRLSDVWWTVIPWILQTLVWIPTQILLRFFLHFRVEGYERIKHVRGPVIFVSNHTSYWDPIMVAAALPFFSRLYPMMYIVRERDYYTPGKKFIGGSSFKMWGAHVAHGGLRNYERSLKNHLHLLNQGRSVCMFPEGSMSKEKGVIQPFKGGVGYLAHHSKATIVPVSITDMFQVTAKDFFSRKRHAKLTFGEPLSCAGVCISASPTVEDYKRVASVIHQKVEELLKRKYNNHI